MRVRRLAELPHNVVVHPHVWIPMADGSRLSARIWLPEDDDRQHPVPGILEYHPYRKNDRFLEGDDEQHRYFAAHGYACVRVDMRGSGDSDGILVDEYTPQEQQDGIDVIRWIAAQDWCTGAVGMIGRSWGGFNGLQIAAHRPAPLKAVITIASTDDRYAEDVHYSGGCVIASEMLPWATRMLAYNALPPDPDVVGASWRQRWHERMAHTPPFIETWLRHQRRDEYWRQGSVCEDYEAIECAVYAVGGWADPYRNAVLRMVERLSCPRKGLIGPWSHISPHRGRPGPLIGFLQECLRWWDHWLKGHDTGVMDEPILRAWMQEAVPPAEQADDRPGRWVVEPEWPSRGQSQQHWYPAAHGELDVETPKPSTRNVVGLQHTGVDGGTWLCKASPDDLPPDQRADDGRSLAFTSPPLSERIEILGWPTLTLSVRSDQPLALVAVRLCDVAPDGASLLVTKGLLNLTHRDGHATVDTLEAGMTYDVTIGLDAIAHAFAEGHRIRVSLSPTYWPGAWPSPRPVRLEVDTGPDTWLSLPVRDRRAEDEQPDPFDGPEAAPRPATYVASEAAWRRRYLHDVGTGRHEVRWYLERPIDRRLLDNGLGWREDREDRSIHETDPLSAAVQSTWEIAIGRHGWQTRVVSDGTMTADETTFHVTNVLEGFEGEQRVFAKTWTFQIPRDGG
ncbi:MAG: CocE/NonD family hydrolase [Actinophytocola sp.]|nr:CocE/NonD family hydrolase [Actinophytocola sp.]